MVAIRDIDQTIDQVSNQVEPFVLNTLEGIVAFSNGVNNGADNGVNDQVSDGVRDRVVQILDERVHTRVVAILKELVEWTKRSDLFSEMGLTNQSANRKKYLDPLFDLGWIQMEFPDNPTHPNQRYKITAAGVRILELIMG